MRAIEKSLLIQISALSAYNCLLYIIINNYKLLIIIGKLVFTYSKSETAPPEPKAQGECVPWCGQVAHLLLLLAVVATSVSALLVSAAALALAALLGLLLLLLLLLLLRLLLTATLEACHSYTLCFDFIFGPG